MKKFLTFIGVILCCLILIIGGMIAYLTIDEFSPDDVESCEIEGDSTQIVRLDDKITLMSWNVGYGALGDNADFFMDGGKMVNTASKERVLYNLDGISKVVDEVSPDVFFMQEVDRNSTRSHSVDEVAYLRDNGTSPLFKGNDSFATNFKVSFVPLPIPPIGKVNAGLNMFSIYKISSAERLSLPCPFKWPLRTFNLKRCLQVLRLSIEGTDKELDMINLHLEAYDEGEGKIAQTNMLKEFISQEIQKGNYVIVGGDFNQVFSNADSSMYPLHEGTWKPGTVDASEFDDTLTFITDNSSPTCRSLDRIYADAEDKSPEAFQYYLIDGFIVSDNIDIESIRTIDTQFEYSDHNPLVMEVVLRER